jgi:hypothetical protein
MSDLLDEMEKLKEMNPRWADPKGWQEDRTCMMAYLQAEGWRESEILNGFHHARMVMLVYKSMLHDRAAAAKFNATHKRRRGWWRRPK